jgi:hypothetical protein
MVEKDTGGEDVTVGTWVPVTRKKRYDHTRHDAMCRTRHRTDAVVG